MPSVRGKKVLILGDSLSAAAAAPGGQLAAHLQAAGGDVRVNAKVGRSAISFHREPTHAAQLGEIHAWDPDLVVVALGTNDIGYAAGANRAAMIQVRDQLGRGGADVWAFGPPSFAPGARDGGDEVAATMKDVFGARFLDARPLTADLTGTLHRSADRIHFTTAGGKLAGQRMAARFVDAGGARLGLGVALFAVFVAGYFYFR